MQRLALQADPKAAGRPGYFTASRKVLTARGNNFCEPIDGSLQPLRGILNANLELCFSRAATATVHAAVPAFRLKPHSRVIYGVKPASTERHLPRRLGCQGLFVLQPHTKTKINVCNASHGAGISSDAHWARTLQAFFGPLHLRLYLEGPEIVVGDVQFDAASCTYYAHFRLGSPGSYAVNFKVAHHEYWGVDETAHKTRHHWGKYLLSRSFPPLVCTWDGDAILGAAAAAAAEGHEHIANGAKGEASIEQEIAAAAPIPAHGGKVDTRRHLGKAPGLPRIGVELRLPPGFAACDAVLQRRWVQRPFPITLYDGRILKAATYQFLPYASGVVGVEAKLAPPYGIAPSKGAIEITDAQLLGAPRAAAVSAPQLTWMPQSHVVAGLRKWFASPLRDTARRQDSQPLQLFVSGDSQSRSVYWALKNYLATVERYGNEATEAGREVQEAGGITKQQQDDDEAIRRRVAKQKHTQFVASAKEGLSFELRDGKGDKVKFAATNFFTARDGSDGALVRTYYTWDSYLDDIAANADKADVVIAGFGSHPASWGQWSFAKFATRSAEIAKVLCTEGHVKRKPVLFYGCPAWPKMKLVDNFRATNQRLAAFNGMAVAAIERECNNVMAAATAAKGGVHRPVAVGDPAFPVRIIDFFEQSTGLMKQSKDGSHYDGTIVVATLAHDMLSHILDRIEQLTS